MKCRHGEEQRTVFRSDRFYIVDGEWYFSTRENVELGPFVSREEAEVELMLYIRHEAEGGIYDDMQKTAEESQLANARSR